MKNQRFYKIFFSITLISQLIFAANIGFSQFTGKRPGPRQAQQAQEGEKSKSSTSRRQRQQDRLARQSVFQQNHLKFGLGVNYVFLADFLYKYGVTGHYWWADHHQAGGSFLMASEDFTADLQKSYNSSTVSFTDAGWKSHLLMFFDRYYLSETFHLTTGLGWRQGAINIAAVSASESVDTTLTISNIVLRGGLGNHWRLASGLELGAEWLTIDIPITKSVSTELKTQNVGATSQQSLMTTLDRLGNDLAGKATLGLVTGYIGYRF